jgi:hypothetical protein
MAKDSESYSDKEAKARFEAAPKSAMKNASQAAKGKSLR